MIVAVLALLLVAFFWTSSIARGRNAPLTVTSTGKTRGGDTVAGWTPISVSGDKQWATVTSRLELSDGTVLYREVVQVGSSVSVSIAR